MTFSIRPFAQDDRPAVERLLTEAFPTPTESDLVDELRQAEDVIVELVAIEDGQLVGHVLLSRLNAPMHALALGPLGVAPDRQGRGIGTALVEAAVRDARRLDVQLVLVLGDPDYYGRFGFSAEDAASYDCVYASHYLMALRLDPACPRDGRIIYAAPFNALG
ncbi:MAG: N-acetyltransferase [Geminicoccaceae bacterium]